MTYSFLLKVLNLQILQMTTIYVGSKDLAGLLEILRKEFKTAVNCFNRNKMIVNPDKFQSMIRSSKEELSKYVLNINGVDEPWNHLSTYQVLQLDNKLNFEKHISDICKKVRNQLNAICRLQTFMGHKEKEAIINTFVLSNFSYGQRQIQGCCNIQDGCSIPRSASDCCLIWHSSSKKSQNKVEKIHESLNFLLNDFLSSYAGPHQYQWRSKDFVRWFMKFS